MNLCMFVYAFISVFFQLKIGSENYDDILSNYNEEYQRSRELSETISNLNCRILLLETPSTPPAPNAPFNSISKKNTRKQRVSQVGSRRVGDATDGADGDNDNDDVSFKSLKRQLAESVRVFILSCVGEITQ